MFSVLRQLGKDDCFWADLAEAKWGRAVRHLTMASEQEQAADAAGASNSEASHLPASVQAGKWQRYCYHRMSGRTIRSDITHTLFFACQFFEGGGFSVAGAMCIPPVCSSMLRVVLFAQSC
jgi:hypothetical protein